MGSAFYPIQLNIDEQAWPPFAKRMHDQRFNAWKLKVFRRDNYTCQFCGFQASMYMDVLNLDNNYRNNRLSNMVTACPYCSQCFFLEMVGKLDFGGGKVIHLPDMTQNQLNALCHVLFCAIANATDYTAEAQNILNSLRLRANVVEDQLGKNLSDPSMLAQMIIDTPFDDKPNVQKNLLKDLRLLPSKKCFAKQIEQWARIALQENQTS
jgi:intracellular multiplication protein IcmJ